MFLKICDAVNSAHLRGVVHRDLKPSNILIDDRNEPHVVDFGLAQMALPQAQDQATSATPASITTTGQFLGSLPWASPEQAEGHTDDVDARTDVYSLGVILYQMLTREFPYEVIGSLRDVLHNIVTAQPSPPSTVLGDQHRDARRRRSRAPAINPTVDTIVLKALAKRPEDRYPNAGALARDVANLLSGQATVAGSESPGRPGRPIIAIAVSVLMGLMLIAAATVWLTRDSGTPDLAIVVPNDATGDAEVRPAPPSATQAGADDAALPQTRRTGPPSGDTANLDPSDGQRLSPFALVQAPTSIAELRSWTIETIGAQGSFRGMAWSPDGALVATLDHAGVIRLIDAATYDLVRAFVLPLPVEDVTWSDDGRMLIAGEPPHRFVLNAGTGQAVRQEEAAGVYRSITPVGQVGPEKAWCTQALMDRASADVPGGSVYSAAISHDGRKVAFGYRYKPVVRFYDAKSEGFLDELHTSSAGIAALAWSPDDSRLAIASGASTEIWDVQSRTVVSRATRHRDPGRIAWSPDGRVLAIGDAGPTLTFHEVQSQRELFSSPPGAAHQMGTSWSPDGRRVVSTGSDNVRPRLGIWRAATGQLEHIVALADSGASVAPRFVAWSTDGRLIAAAESYRVLVIDADAGTVIWASEQLAPTNRSLADVAFSRDGQLLACVGSSSTIHVFDAATGEPRAQLQTEHDYWHTVAWSPVADHLVVANEKKLEIWDVDGRQLLSRDAFGPWPVSLRWSSNGTRLAVGVAAGRGSPNLWIINIEDGSVLRSLRFGDHLGPDLARHSLGHIDAYWIEDGESLLIACETSDFLSRVDVRSGRELGRIRGPIASRLTADGTIAWSLTDRSGIWPHWTRRGAWDATTGQPLGMLVVLSADPLRYLAVGPGGHYTGSEAVDREIVYIALTEDGQQLTFTPAEFAKAYGWRNDPAKVQLGPRPE